MRNKNVITKDWYKKLRSAHGKPSGQWTLWCKRPKTERERQQVTMEAILTQRTNWRNVERAVAALKEARLLSLNAFLNAYRKNPARTALLIKSSGFYREKAERLAGLAAFVKKRYGAITAMKKAELMRLRAELLSLNGIGPETADSILLYALDKPIFVIDEYTRRFLGNPLRSRLFKRPALPKSGRSRLQTKISKMAYGALQQLFQKSLKKDYRLYQDFHALIVIDQKKSNSARYNL